MRTLQEFLGLMRHLERREAVVWSNGFRTWTATYADLYGAVGAVTNHFDELGISTGDRVLVVAKNQLEWIAVFWACVARGIQVVPVDYRFSRELVNRIEAEAKPKLIIDNAYLDRLAKLAPDSRFQCTPVDPDDIVEIVYTSGTTGEPKGVVHRHRNICSNLNPFLTEIAKYKKWAAPFQPVRILDLLPLSHMFGQSMGLFMPVMLGGSTVMTTEIHPQRIIQLIHDNRITVAVCVPRILENLKTAVEKHGTIATHSRFGWKFWAFVVGGARLDPELESFWTRRRFVVIQGYGLTEASPVVAVNHPFRVQHGSLGKVVPGQDVVIADDGEILVRGESVTTEGEWLHTGDLGEIDAEGNLYFRGRKKDLIVTPEGLNVYPDDVERVLNSLPEVRASAVVGSDHVHAVLILAESQADIAALIQKANAKLESHQRIRTWSIWPNDDFPRTPSTLKVKRHEIARAVAGAAAPAKAPVADLSAMSSLERVELLSTLEEQYQTELDEDAFSRLTSTPQLEQWLRHSTTTSEPLDRSSDISQWSQTVPVRALRKMFQQILAIPLFRALLPFKVTGLENLSSIQPPVIFAANHTSHLDVPAILTALPRKWRSRAAPAMSKDHFRAYFEPKGFPWWRGLFSGLTYMLARSLYNTYPLPQQMAGARRALRYTGELIDRGYCPLVFPEGNRTRDGAMLPFRPGIGMMAVRLRVPVVPVRVKGLYEIYSIHDSWPRRGPVEVSIGSPMTFSEDTRYEDVAEALAQAVRKL
jgi:long-chain acyl-CoA synthetase